ncbi:MAG: hypothetical protein ACLFUI_00780 [Halanaerobiales bacterium]
MNRKMDEFQKLIEKKKKEMKMKSPGSTTEKDIDKIRKYYSDKEAINRIYSQLVKKSNIPEKFKDVTFSSFNLDETNKKNVKKVKAIMNYGRNIIKAMPQSLYMFSEYNGCGKTHLAVAILKKAAHEYASLIFEKDPLKYRRRGINLNYIQESPVFFMSEKNYLYKKKLAFSSNDQAIHEEVEYIEKMVIKSKLLVIDDFLKERNTDFTFNELTAWICLRYEDNKPVIFTSNMDFMDLAKENKENPFYKTPHFKNATYLASRVEEMTKGYKFYFYSSYEDDYRHKKFIHS